MRKYLMRIYVVFLLIITSCGEYKELAGEYTFDNSVLILEEDGRCIIINGDRQKEASFKVLGSTLIILENHKGNINISTLDIDGDRLLGKTQHWGSGSKRMIYTRKK